MDGDLWLNRFSFRDRELWGAERADVINNKYVLYRGDSHSHPAKGEHKSYTRSKGGEGVEPWGASRGQGWGPAGPWPCRESLPGDTGETGGTGEEHWGGALGALGSLAVPSLEGSSQSSELFNAFGLGLYGSFQSIPPNFDIIKSLISLKSLDMQNAAQKPGCSLCNIVWRWITGFWPLQNASVDLSRFILGMTLLTYKCYYQEHQNASKLWVTTSQGRTTEVIKELEELRGKD